jgi:hypothetical protein
MGCVCGDAGIVLGCTSDPMHALVCQTATLSSRAFKADIEYLGEEERASLARQALSIPLAQYRYKTEPSSARRRLGFIIEDQPDASPAVEADRRHVDQYGYASMLLATIQEQAKEIAELRARVERLEDSPAPARKSDKEVGRAASVR